jgi:hypothetical protein
VRSLLQFVLPPPAASNAASFSVVVIADAGAPGAAETTLASVLAQTQGPDEIFLVLSAEASSEFDSPKELIEIVRLPADEPPAAVVNSLAGRMRGSHLIILDAGATLAHDRSDHLRRWGRPR